MPVIKVNDQQFLLRPGPNRVGAGADVDIRVADNAAIGVQAIVDVEGEGEGDAGRHAVIRSAGNGVSVRVNGVPLVDPTPLIHGDKVEIAGSELLFAEDSKVGATQYVSVNEVAAAARRSGPARATAATGGRLVSLVDGKEYTVPADGLVIGRDAASDVVVPENEVSRRHAHLVAVPDGYELRDLSANGVFVNGVRIGDAHTLSRADVIRVGGEEFRFYADVPSPVASISKEVVVPLPRPADERPVLATLEITNEGPTKGLQHLLRVPVVSIGRGGHNDVVIEEPSVSDTHAKLERRADGWVLVDLRSTNGTYVAGQRLVGERAIYGGLSLRFGGVKMIFRPGATANAPIAYEPPAGPASGRTRRDAPQITTAPPPVISPTRGLTRWVWSAVILLAGAAVFFFLLNH